MANQTYFQKALGTTSASAGVNLTIYGTVDHRPGEIFLENVSDGAKAWGTETAFAKRVYLKQGADGTWTGSYDECSGQSQTSALIDLTNGYSVRNWSNTGNVRAYTGSDFETAFGRPITQLLAYPVNEKTLKSTEKTASFDSVSGYYIMSFEINTAEPSAVAGYKKQVATMSGQNVNGFDHANFTFWFDENYRLIQFRVDESYTVDAPIIGSATTSNKITYTNYFDPEGFSVRSF